MCLPYLSIPRFKRRRGRHPPPPEAATIVARYRAAIAHKGLMPALIWGDNTEANRQRLLEAAASVDRSVGASRAFNEALNGSGGLDDVSRAVEGVLLDRAAKRDAAGVGANYSHYRLGERTRQAVNQIFCCPVVHSTQNSAS